MSKPPDTTIEVLSLRDGKASIEHQIDIHVLDLVDIANNTDISLLEVLAGLRYVMDFRLKGGRQPSLDLDLMRRLCEGLLLNMGATEGTLLRRKTTKEADMAFELFGEFLEEVEEFHVAVSTKSVSDLRHALKLHRRCQPSSSLPQKQSAVSILHLLTTSLSHLSDWHDLVKESSHDEVEKLLNSPIAQEVIAKEKSNHTHNPQEPLLPPPALYFDRTVPKLLKMFPSSDPEKGLPSDAVPALLRHYGYNRLPDPPKPSVWKMIWVQLTDFMVLILAAASIVTGAEQDFKGMSVLLAVIFLNTVIGFTQEWKASRALDALMRLGVPQAHVVRDGKPQHIDSAELVPGDIVILEEGDAVPADLRLIDVAQLEAVEAVLTGESVPVLKGTGAVKVRSRKLPLSDCTGNAFMTTVVARGRARGLVVRTGPHTEIGRISAAVTAGAQKKVRTPVQRKLSRLGKYLVALAVVLCVLVVVVGVAWKRNVKDMINVGLSLAVSVIPEGLVAVVTVTMALGVRRMAARNCIVRTLPAVETLGSVTVICSDKTGTLTEGKMGTSELWTTDNSLFRFTESTSLNPSNGEVILESADLRRRMIQTSHLEDKSSPFAAPPPPSTPPNYAALRPRALPRDDPRAVPEHLRYALMVAALCNNASVTPRGDDEALGSKVDKVNEESEWKTVGDPTEVALVVAADKAGCGREHWITTYAMQRIYERAFDSERKLMSVVCRAGGTEGGVEETDSVDLVLAKGAPEELLRKCVAFLPNLPPADEAAATTLSARLNHTFHPTPLTDSFLELVSQESSRMASHGLRVLGLALKCVNGEGDMTSGGGIERDPAYAEDGFVFCGLIGLIDPPRPGVKEAVERCQGAGIRVVMITGDHVATASAIAGELGIIKKGVAGMSRAIKGQELDLLSDEALTELSPFPNVFARVSPDNKLRIVKALQKRGELVAMTGDGVNDAPAIKSADVGVAMGLAGTEITKQAADLVLANDDFTTIVAAVEEGRQVFDNILKFIVYLLSCNGAEIFLMLICACANIDLPFTTIMILWANIIADIPPAMALGLEPAEKELMRRRPRDPSAGVLTRVTWTVVGLQAAVMAILTVAIYTIALYVEKIPEADARSLAFALLTTLQLLQAFLSRTVNQSVFRIGVTGNPSMLFAVGGSFLAMLIGIYVPGISDWLTLTWVGWLGWCKIGACCIVLVIFSEVEKLIIRRAGWAF